jgi:hypothetical protein
MKLLNGPQAKLADQEESATTPVAEAVKKSYWWNSKEIEDTFRKWSAAFDRPKRFNIDHDEPKEVYTGFFSGYDYCANGDQSGFAAYTVVEGAVKLLTQRAGHEI